MMILGRSDLANGTKVRFIGPNGVKGEIVGTDCFYYDGKLVLNYLVKVERTNSITRFGWDTILPVNHPWHSQMDKWVAEGKKKKFTHIFIGLDEKNRKYKAFFGNSYGYLDVLTKKYPDLIFKLYWAFPE